MTGMLDVVIREAVEADAEAACRVLRRSITECCIADHCNDQELLNAWLRNKTPENVIAWITHDKNITRVAVTGNRIVGFAMLQKSGYLALNYILPEVLFQGVGRALLQALESAAVELRLHELTLKAQEPHTIFIFATASKYPELRRLVPAWRAGSCERAVI